MQLLKEGKLDLRPLVSAEFPLEEWEKGFDLTMSKTAFRVLLIP
jgi:threonine dehydrogenase-like Zn-dependent dehydrogenase